MRVRVPPAAPRRRGLRIVRGGVFFFKANAVSHSLRRSSFPDRTRFAWLRSGQGRKAPPFVWYPYLVAGLEQGGGEAAKNMPVACFLARGKVPQPGPRRRKLRIACGGAFFAPPVRSLRCSSFPDRTHSVGLRSGIPKPDP